MKFQYEKEYDNVFDELKDRGYFEAATDEEELAEKLKNENNGNILGLYIESLSGYPAVSLEYQALGEGVQALMETRRG